jgi:transcriptional regulator with XRE-family HTH domain
MQSSAREKWTRFPRVAADLDYVTIGRRIAAQRTFLDMTQQELADRSHVSQRTIAMLERGRRGGLRVNTLVDIASALQVRVIFLLTGHEQEDEPSDVN